MKQLLRSLIPDSVSPFFYRIYRKMYWEIYGVLSNPDENEIYSDEFLLYISGLIHVGANDGEERHLYDRYGLEVVWIEPIPEVFSKLVQNINNFRKQNAYQELITDVDGKEYQFNVANNYGASSSILDLNEHKDIWPEVGYSETVNIESITLDSLFERECLDSSKYQALVMDTQGTELLVLQGSLSILNNIEYIKTEVPDFESYTGCCKVSDMEKFMTENGYKEIVRNKFASRPQGGNYFDIIYKKIA